MHGHGTAERSLCFLRRGPMIPLQRQVLDNSLSYSNLFYFSPVIRIFFLPGAISIPSAHGDEHTVEVILLNH